MSISENIKKIRKDNNLTQKQFAELINKKERTIQKYESGDIVPPINVINELSEKFDIPVSEIIGDDPRSDINRNFVISEAEKYDNFNIGINNALDKLHKKPSEIKIENRINKISESIDLFLSDRNLEEEFDYKFSELDIFEQNEINSFIFHMIDIKINEIKLRKQYNEKFKNIKEGE